MTCLRAGGVGKKVELPLGGVLGSAQSPEAAAFWPEHSLLSEAAHGYLYQQEWEKYGRINASAKPQHLYLSNDGLKFF